MKHPTYENWILKHETLTQAQRLELEDHLQTCQYCALFAEAERSVRQMLQEAPMAAPMPGFRARFEQRLAAKRAAQHKRQVSITLAVSAVLAGVLGSGVIVSMLMLLLSSDTAIFQLFQNMFHVLQVIVLAGSAGKALLGSLGGIVDPAFGYTAAAAAAVLCLTWFASLLRIRSIQERRE
ncbi:MAG: hypothetical protein JXA25_05610 [Anaerolineales bacterium]|nr:hypothetical protein [Anaerolineales bacterium]